MDKNIFDNLFANTRDKSEREPEFLYCIDKNQFSFGKVGATACTSISITVIHDFAYCNRSNTEYEFDDVIDLNWINSLSRGIELWNVASYVLDSIDGFNYTREIFELKKLKSFKKTLNLRKEINGILHIGENELKIMGEFSSDELVMTLEDAIDELFKLGKENYAVITIRGHSFALINHNDTTVCLFDSYPNKEMSEYSTLAKFYNMESLVSYIRQRYPSNFFDSFRKTQFQSNQNQFFITFFSKNK